jgi:hypothetical protein
MVTASPAGFKHLLGESEFNTEKNPLISQKILKDLMARWILYG